MFSFSSSAADNCGVSYVLFRRTSSGQIELEDKRMSRTDDSKQSVLATDVAGENFFRRKIDAELGVTREIQSFHRN